MRLKVSINRIINNLCGITNIHRSLHNHTHCNRYYSGIEYLYAYFKREGLPACYPYPILPVKIRVSHRRNQHGPANRIQCQSRIHEAKLPHRYRPTRFLRDKATRSATHISAMNKRHVCYFLQQTDNLRQACGTDTGYSPAY